jgi:hypothetical protein
LARGGARIEIVKHACRLREDFRRFATRERPVLLLGGSAAGGWPQHHGAQNEGASTPRGWGARSEPKTDYSLIFATTLLVRSVTVRPRSSFISFFLVTKSLLSASATLLTALLMRVFIRVIKCLPCAE